MSYSTQRITSTLMDEVKRALHKVTYGSIEIIVQDNVVTQITVRNIKKTSYKIQASVYEDSENSVKTSSISTKATQQKIRVLTIKKE